MYTALGLFVASNFPICCIGELDSKLTNSKKRIINIVAFCVSSLSLAILIDRWAVKKDLKQPMLLLGLLFAPHVGLLGATATVKDDMPSLPLAILFALLVQGLNFVTVYLLSPKMSVVYASWGIFPMIGVTVIFWDELLRHVMVRSLRDKSFVIYDAILMYVKLIWIIVRLIAFLVMVIINGFFIIAFIFIWLIKDKLCCGDDDGCFGLTFRTIFFSCRWAG